MSSALLLKVIFQALMDMLQGKGGISAKTRGGKLSEVERAQRVKVLRNQYQTWKDSPQTDVTSHHALLQEGTILSDSS